MLTQSGRRQRKPIDSNRELPRLQCTVEQPPAGNLPQIQPALGADTQRERSLAVGGVLFSLSAPTLTLCYTTNVDWVARSLRRTL